MLKFIDEWLNRTTMYRVVLYYLLTLWLVAIVCGAFGLLPYQPLAMLISAGVIFAAAWATNTLFAAIFKAPANVESVYITAAILALVMTPLASFADVSGFFFLIWAPVLAMASKYILAVRKKHIFNPAAIALVATAFAMDRSATWWVGGSMIMLPFVIAGGILVIRKIQRWDLAFGFMIPAVLLSLWFGAQRGTDAMTTLEQVLLHTPLFFFAAVMITEPMTAPPRRLLRIVYAALVGLLFVPAVHVWSIFSTPELALVTGNVFSYLVSPKRKLVLKLKERVRVAADVYDFVFHPEERLAFRPGQYMEWTLGHARPDDRGNRRYFTLASSPTEEDVRIGVKFYPKASSFKESLIAFGGAKEIVASQLAGDFTLPWRKKRKLAFIAGGIGVTPFRSMIKYLSDRGEARSIVLFYANRTPADIAYQDLFDEASRRIGLRTVHVLSDKTSVPAGWTGETGYLDAEMLRRQVPDYRERTFYVSGPRAMVLAAEAALKDLGVRKHRIRKDFFPGFA